MSVPRRRSNESSTYSFRSGQTGLSHRFFQQPAKAVNWESCQAVDRNPAKLGGVWCFAGYQTPVQSLFEHFDKGATVDEFLEWFPEVSRLQIHEVLEFAKASLERPAAVA